MHARALLEEWRDRRLRMALDRPRYAARRLVFYSPALATHRRTARRVWTRELMGLAKRE